MLNNIYPVNCIQRVRSCVHVPIYINFCNHTVLKVCAVYLKGISFRGNLFLQICFSKISLGKVEFIFAVLHIFFSEENFAGTYFRVYIQVIKKSVEHTKFISCTSTKKKRK